MKILTVICNVVFWVFFCTVILTDGLPKGIAIIWSIVPFLMPMVNVAVIGILSSPSRVLKLVVLVSNVVWLGLACWRILQELPSHPKEEGLLEFVVLFALTPLLSVAAIYISLRASEPTARISPEPTRIC